LPAFVLAISTLLQFAAAGLALRLVWITQRRAAWLLISTGVFLMAVRRCITLSHLLLSETPRQPDLIAELVALVISVCMVLGIALIAPVFQEILRVSAEVRKGEARLRDVIDNMGALIHLKDTDGRYLLVNKLFEQSVGRSTEDLAGLTDLAIFPAHLAAKLRRHDAQVLELCEPKEFDERRPDTQGVERDYIAIRFPLRDSDGGVYGIGGIATDISHRLAREREDRELETTMLHTQKLESLGILAGGIAHDFNNLLVPITATVDLIEEDLTARRPVNTSDLDAIRSASRRAAHLCKQLLAYAGRDPVDRRPLDLSQQVREIMPLVELSAKGATLHYDLAADLPCVDIDPAQLHQVIMNLVLNAVEAAEGAPIAITLETGLETLSDEELRSDYLPGVQPKPGQYVFFQVTDTGPGLTEDIQRKLFEPFFTTKFTGRGLGLSAVLGIVRSSSGSIAVRTELGSGTSIRIRLPVTERTQADDTGPGTERERRESSTTVLVVDDEPQVRQVARRVLERAGMSVLTASNGRVALDMFHAHRDQIRVVLLDLTMPELSGDAAFEELKRLSPGLRVVISSGYSEAMTRAKHSLEGIAGFLDKPYSATELTEAIRAAASPDTSPGRS